MTIGMGYPLMKLPPWFGGQVGIAGSTNPLGFRLEPQGNVYYVDGDSGNDSNIGTDPLVPFATIAAAITAHNANIDWAATPPYNGVDLIVIAPGVYAENLTPPYYCNVLGLGHANGGDWCVNVEPAAGSALAGNGNYTHWKNIRFTTNTAAPVMDLNVANSMIVEDCMIVDGNPGLATVLIDMQNAGGSKFINNNLTYTASACPIGIRSTGNFFDCQIIGNHIKAATTGIDLSGAALVGGTLIAHNYIARPTTGINDAVGGTFCVDNWISALVDAISHAALATMCIANHVLDNAVGGIEAAGTD